MIKCDNKSYEINYIFYNYFVYFIETRKKDVITSN